MKKAVHLFYLILFIPEILNARAGSGFSGGGHHFSRGGFHYYGGRHHYGYGHTEPISTTEVILILLILAFFVFLMFYGFAIVLKIRKQKTAKKIQKSAESDPLWNHNNLIDMVREVYPQIQEAWTMRELKNVAHLVTLSFIQKYQPILNGYKQRNIINVLDSITVEDIVITSIKDDNDNSKDLFKVYIKGKMRDFLTHEKGFTQLMNKQSNVNDFEDLFIFVRNNNSWLLHDIINEPTGFDIR